MDKERHANLIADLNPEQELAVLHREGPALVLAGAGSGKTKVLTTRAAHLIADMGVLPGEILLVTFTNKAAAEMKRRVAALTQMELPLAGTFHSLGAKILRRHAPALKLDHNFTIYDSDDQLALLKDIYKNNGWNTREFKPAAVLGAISTAKNKLWSPQEYEDRARGDFGEFVARAYKIYERRLRGEEAVDFDDLLVLTVKLFQENPDILQFYQQTLKHILVDEYQDTNKAQYLLTKMLAAPQNNLFVVGDFSQSIYAWRGADLKNMQALERDFPGITTYHLEQNYRSTPNILAAANNVISKNTDHPILDLWTEKKLGEQITVIDAPTNNTEASAVIKEIETLKRYYSLNDMVILYRTNAQSRAFEEALTKAALPYRLVGGFKFYERKEIKDLLAYLRLFVNPRESVSHTRAIKIGKRRFAAYEDWRLAKQKNLSNEELTNFKPYDLLKEIIEVTTYRETFDKNDPEDIARLENIEELLVSAASFEQVTQFLENVALIQDEQSPDKDLSQKSQRPEVTLMSLHSAKGLEFAVVFIVGLEEGLLPHSRALFEAKELAEERRLMYVGITRAKEKLFLSHARRRFLYGSVSASVPSRFLADLDKNILQLKTVSDYEETKDISPFRRGFFNKELKKERKIEKPLDNGRKLVIDDNMLDEILRDDLDIATFLRS